MSGAEPARIVARWFGVFLVRGATVERARPFPTDPGALAARLALRREGRLAPEEEALRNEFAGTTALARDRRFVGPGVRWSAGPEPWIDPAAHGFAPSSLRELLLESAESELVRAWDPTVHVQEAVRALTDLDGAINTVGERLANWAAHDRGRSVPEAGGPRTVAEGLLAAEEPTRLAALVVDPGLAEARRRLAALYLALLGAHEAIEHGLSESMPTRAPNLTALLGPLLAARLVSQAGGLERLARLPAGTVQVLGAERAFFEHLRGRAPPPKHGLLFLHPRLHGAPRAERGRLARALAGKVVLGARLDRGGRPLDPALAERFTARAEEIRRRPRRSGRTRDSRPPLDGAAEHG
jgi:nucleolar protein 56